MKTLSCFLTGNGTGGESIYGGTFSGEYSGTEGTYDCLPPPCLPPPFLMSKEWKLLPVGTDRGEMRPTSEDFAEHSFFRSFCKILTQIFLKVDAIIFKLPLV